MRFDIITIFPDIFESYFNESILKRARETNAVELNVHNLRDHTTDKHKTVDDTPYGGGAGMVMKVEPLDRAIESIRSYDEKIKTRVVLFSAKGKKYTQQDAMRLKEYDQIIMICGRYEGIDERVAQHVADEEVSIGNYVLTGGEIPAMVVADSITRLLPGVLGNPASLEEESHGEVLDAEYPQYTRPEEYKDWKVPEVLLGGNHAQIDQWRNENSQKI